MGTTAKSHGPVFASLETTERLSGGQIDVRAQKLLGQLTHDEKIKMMSGDPPFWLGIPGVRIADGPRGVIMDGGTTFPVSMGRGATFDPELEEQVGDVIGRELRAMGGNFFGGVCINLLRHPAWGRAQETYGEDPVHLGELGLRWCAASRST